MSRIHDPQLDEGYRLWIRDGRPLPLRVNRTRYDAELVSWEVLSGVEMVAEFDTWREAQDWAARQAALSKLRPVRPVRPVRLERPKPAPPKPAPVVVVDTAGPRRPRRPVTPELIEAVRELNADGLTDTQIALQLDRSQPVISKIRRELELPRVEVRS